VTSVIEDVTLPPPAVDGRALRRRRNAERLYDAADELLATRSYEELTIEEICQRANVGRATFFRIYDTKAGLLREFNRRLAQDAAERIRAAGSVGVRTALGHVRDAIVDAWRHAGPGHAGMAREFARSVPTTDLHAAHPELLALVVERISIAVEAGELPGTVPVDLAASLALIHMTAAVACAIAGRDVDIDNLSRILLDQWFTGMSEGSHD
jgi:AcrR family transcriptional regulator